MYVVVDRIEGNYIVCEKEDRKTINIEKHKVSGVVKSGDVLRLEGDNIFVDKEKTLERKKFKNCFIIYSNKNGIRNYV